jgi:hypothetical protein
MKKLLLICVAACLNVVASAQKVYFLYLQSDDQAPFYVRMGDKIHSSASSGYLIIPNLTDSTYTFGLGFAKNTNAETTFSVSINQDDKGFVIKNFETGLALFDFRDLSIVKANTVQTNNTVYETRSDNFSAVLSKAANDPGLLKVPVAKKETPASEKPVEKEPVTAKVEEVKPANQEKPVETVKEPEVAPTPQTEVAKQAEPKQNPVVDSTLTSQTAKEIAAKETPAETKPEPVLTANETVFKRSVVTRYAESSTTEGFGVVYFDKQDEKMDTIRILIPPSKVRLDEGAQTASLSDIEKNTTSTPTEARQLEVKAAEEKPEVKQPVREEKEAVASETSIAPAIASSCKDMASDKDFMKLRKKMASRNTDEEMIEDARKVYRSKCFSVEQLRYLSSLFLTSAAKYQFFDASYNYVSDKQNFASLKGEIRDEYYLNRFKALVGE